MKWMNRGIRRFFRYYFTDYNPISGFWSEAAYSWWEYLFWNTFMGALMGLFYGVIITAVFGLVIWILSHFDTVPVVSDYVNYWMDLLQARKRFDF